MSLGWMEKKSPLELVKSKNCNIPKYNIKGKQNKIT